MIVVTQKRLADHIGHDVKVINRLVNGHTSVRADMAVKLGSTFGTTPDFWLNAQQAMDLFKAMRRIHRPPRPLVSTEQRVAV